jgi:Spy/CpxP family protein refolding chaperone
MMKPKWKITLVLLALVLVSFAAGGFLGAKMVDRAYKRRHAPEMWNQTVMRALKQRLKLTPEQIQKVQAIIDTGVEEMKTVRLETIARTDTVFDRMADKIDHELTPEQSAELQKLKKERGVTTIDMLKVEPRKTK